MKLRYIDTGAGKSFPLTCRKLSFCKVALLVLLILILSKQMHTAA